MVRQMLRSGLLAPVTSRVLVAMKVIIFTMGMVEICNVNVRPPSTITWRIDGRMRVGKRIPNDEERNN